MRRLLALVVAIGALIGVLWLIPSDHYLFLPDTARPVDPLVKLPGERASSEKEGIYMVDVFVRKASLLERLIPRIEEGSTLVPATRVNPHGLSERERRRSSLNEMSVSQKTAVVVALRELGYRVKVTRKGAEVVQVFADLPAEGRLEPGDVIVAARGEPVVSLDDLSTIMRAVRPGEEVSLEILRSGERRDLRLETEASPDEKERAIFGITVRQAADVDLPLKVRIDAGDVGGPSAGLAFALDVVDELGRDVDGGRRIAVTGELDLDGAGIPIGGVKQKTIGARNADADVFIVPRANAEEARRYAGALRIVPVSSFRHALSVLAKES